MERRSNLWKRATNLVASAAALAIFSPASPAAAQDNPDDAQLDTVSQQKLLFTALPGLDAAETQERLAEMRKNPETEKFLAVLTTALSVKSTKSKDIEQDVLALIKGQKPEVAQQILDAVVRDYYDHNVLGDSDNSSVVAVVMELQKVDDKLTTAAFGARDRGARQRAVRKIRHRV